jgi:hypothetical protein
MGESSMQVIKFVTEDFKSPGDYEKLDYSKFGIPIEVEADPKESGQCARGIHVVPINEDADFENVIFTGTMILLEVAEEDIVYCEKNGKMRVRKATPIKRVKKSDKEIRIIRTAACKKPYNAYLYALNVDKKPTDDTRTAACNDPGCAYKYALHVDGRPKGETRTGVCNDPGYAYLYAIEVDKRSTSEIRTAVCKDPCYAYCYAIVVDKKPLDETRTAACQDSEYAYWYAVEVDKKPTDETRTAACKNPYYAYYYAINVDKKPTDETRIVASKDEYCKKQYEQWEKSKCK